MPKPNQRNGLTLKEERFVAEYIVDGNGTRSALAAGYSKGCAQQQATEMLAKPRVRQAIDDRKGKLLAKLELTAEKVLRDIDRIATAAEKVGEFGPALRGRELLGKHLRMFTDKVELTGEVAVKKSAADLTDDELATIAAKKASRAANA